MDRGALSQYRCDASLICSGAPFSVWEAVHGAHYGVLSGRHRARGPYQSVLVAGDPGAEPWPQSGGAVHGEGCEPGGEKSSLAETWPVFITVVIPRPRSFPAFLHPDARSAVAE